MKSNEGCRTFLLPAAAAATVEKGLLEAGTELRKLGPASWRCVLSNGTTVRVGARLDSEWLSMSARLSRGPGAGMGIDPWALLEANTGLAGSVKLAVLPVDPGLFIRAELPVGPTAGLDLRVLQACAGFKQAAALYFRLTKQGNVEIPCATRAVKDAALESEHIDLPGLAGEAGWEVTERPDGTHLVTLDLPNEFAQAQVGTGEGGTVRVATEIPPCSGTPSPCCRKALGVLLLRVSGAVRLARAAAERSTGDGSDGAGGCFEVVFDSRPCAAELDHALAALSVACRLSRREARLLVSDERIAAAYLRAFAAGAGSKDEVGKSRWSGQETRQEKEE